MLWVLAISTVTMDTPLPLTMDQCQQGITDCNKHESVLELIPGAFTVYADCLKSNIKVDDGCRRSLNAFIKAWNKFVDFCELCGSSSSPLVHSCPDSGDQNMICPSKMDELTSPDSEEISSGQKTDPSTFPPPLSHVIV